MPEQFNIKSMLYTLVFLRKNSQILMGYKTRGLGVGKWNGFGGKLEKNETLHECARRELMEECNLKANVLTHIGAVKYTVLERSTSIVHVFVSDDFEGMEKPSEEMNPIRWFHEKEIPFDKMWPCARKWFPFLLSNKIFSVHCVYTKDLIIKDTNVAEHGSIQEAVKYLNIS